MLIKEWIESFIPYTSLVKKNEHDRILICFAEKACILDLQTWEKLRTLTVNTPTAQIKVGQEKEIDKSIPLIEEHIVPETDYQFMIETYDS